MSLFTRLLLKLGYLDRLTWLRSKGMIIGERCFILDEVRIDPGFEHLIMLGDEVTISPQVFLLAHDACTKRALGLTRKMMVKIGSRTFIGARALIMPGVTIGDDCIIGAGSVVTHDIPNNSVACGNPARVTMGMEHFLKRRASA